jgi:hypothetical protein
MTLLIERVQPNETFQRFQILGLIIFVMAAGANVVGGLVLVKSGAHRLGERFQIPCCTRRGLHACSYLYQFS